MLIYTPQDKITLHIDDSDISFVVSPLSFKQKSEIQATLKKIKNSEDPELIMQEAMFQTLRYAIKEVNGFKTPDGKPWTPVKDGVISDEDLSSLISVELTEQAIGYISSFLRSIPTELPDGVSFKKKPKTTKNKQSKNSP